MVAQEKKEVFADPREGKKKGGNQKKTPGPIQTPFNDGITIHKNFTFPSPLLEPEEGERTRKGLKMLRRGREGELPVSLTVKRVCARVCLLCLCVLPDFPSFFFLWNVSVFFSGSTSCPPPLSRAMLRETGKGILPVKEKNPSVNKARRERE